MDWKLSQFTFTGATLHTRSPKSNALKIATVPLWTSSKRRTRTEPCQSFRYCFWIKCAPENNRIAPKSEMAFLLLVGIQQYSFTTRVSELSSLRPTTGEVGSYVVCSTNRPEIKASSNSSQKAKIGKHSPSSSITASVDTCTLNQSPCMSLCGRGSGWIKLNECRYRGTSI